MKQHIIAAAIGITAGLFVTTQFAGPLVAQEAKRDRTTYENLDLFGDIFERIRASYVEEADDDKLIEAAINGMLNSLDPHSSYLPPEAFDEMRTQTRGEFGGLGIEVTQENGWVKVVTPMDDTPAAAAGMQPGDLITHLDGESLMGLTLSEAVDKLRGPVGSDIVITVVRENVAEPFDVTLTRDTIELKAVRARLDGDVIVARVASFTEKTYSGLEEGIAEMIAELGGMDEVSGLVLDLRNNPGGLLNQAVAVSDAFLEAGEIVSTRGREAEESSRFNARAGDLMEGKPIVVLINSGSASASEIVAGALQDHRRAVIVGTKSFGKGSVQTVMPLQGEGAIRLTTARYYTPSGRSIQALGVSPDVIVEWQQPEPESEEEGAADKRRSEADLRGSLGNDSLTEDEKTQLEEERAALEESARRHAEDNQLGYAVDLIRGMTVLGR